MAGIIARLALAVGLTLMASAAHAQPLRLMIVDIARPGIDQLLPGFDKLYGHQVKIEVASADRLAARIEAGEAADVIILDAATLDRLEARKRLRHLEVAELGRAGLGVAVRAGAPVPAVFTEDEFKASLLAARTIAYADGQAGAAAPFHAALAKLALANRLTSKLRPMQQAEMVEKTVASGDIDIAIGWAHEFVSRPGLVLAGFLPHSLQRWINLRAVRVSDGEPARAFIDYIADDDSLKLFTRGGYR